MTFITLHTHGDILWFATSTRIPQSGPVVEITVRSIPDWTCVYYLLHTPVEPVWVCESALFKSEEELLKSF